MAHSTREQLLQTAKKLFAEHGFAGVSIANVADEHGLTKQALLHHFASKEKLYGEVLKRISEEFDPVRAAADASGQEEALPHIKALLRDLIPKTETDRVRTRLLMRELLDNPERAGQAGTWYLKPLLLALIALAKRLPGWAHASDAQALALIYQLLGAVTYYAVSETTLRGMFGAEGFKALNRAFPAQLDALVEAAVTNPPA